MFRYEHTPERVAAKAATCTDGGNSEYYRCAECGELFSDPDCKNGTTAEAQRIDPKGHTWADATCTVPKTCSECNVTDGAALGHEWSGGCDTDCNREGCTETRVTESHLDADENGVCENCGEDISTDITVGDGEGGYFPEDEF